MNSRAPSGQLVNFGTALHRYAQVLTALLWRELAKRWHSPAETILMVMEPVVLIVGMGFIYWALERHNAPVGGSPILFFGTGLYIKYYFIHVSQRLAQTRRGTRLPVELWIDQLLIYVVLRFVDYIVLGIIAVLLLKVFGDIDAVPSNPARVLEAMGYMTMLAFGWGIIGFTMAKLSGGMGRYIFGLINRMLVWLSGAMFVIDFMPATTRYWLSFIPTAHAVIIFRQGFYPNYPSLTLDTSYLVGCSLAAVMIGFLFERALRRRFDTT